MTRSPCRVGHDCFLLVVRGFDAPITSVMRSRGYALMTPGASRCRKSTLSGRYRANRHGCHASGSAARFELVTAVSSGSRRKRRGDGADAGDAPREPLALAEPRRSRATSRQAASSLRGTSVGGERRLRHFWGRTSAAMAICSACVCCARPLSVTRRASEPPLARPCAPCRRCGWRAPRAIGWFGPPRRSAVSRAESSPSWVTGRAAVAA